MYYRIGKAIRVLRAINSLSQAELANKINCSKSYISEIESDKKYPSIKILIQVTDTFNLKLSEFFNAVENLEVNNQFTIKQNENRNGYQTNQKKEH